MASTSLAFSTVLKADRSPTSRASRSPQARYPSRCSSSFSVSERFFVSVIASSSALDTSGQSSAGREKNVPRWSQRTRSRFLAGRNWGEETRSCAKLLIDEPPGPPWAIKSGSGARFFGIALDNNRSQPNGRPGKIRVPARHSDEAALYIPPFGLDLKDVTVGL